MKYSTYTTGVDLRDKEIYPLLKKILKQKEQFLRRVTAASKGEIPGLRDSREFGEALKDIIKFFLNRGEVILDELRVAPIYRHALYEVHIASFIRLQQELERWSLDYDLRELILCLWALKIKEGDSSYDKFMVSLQEYFFNEMNRLVIEKRKHNAVVEEKVMA